MDLFIRRYGTPLYGTGPISNLSPSIRLSSAYVLFICNSAYRELFTAFLCTLYIFPLAKDKFCSPNCYIYLQTKGATEIKFVFHA